MEQHDQFGNTIEYGKYDGKQTRITRSTRNSYFEFMGNVYSHGMLRRNKEVKVYYKSNSSDAVLQQDSYGRLFLYFYDEYDFDRVDELWVLVADEADADEMVKVTRLSRVRIPFIASDGEIWLGAREYKDIDTEKINQP